MSGDKFQGVSLTILRNLLEEAFEKLSGGEDMKTRDVEEKLVKTGAGR